MNKPMHNKIIPCINSLKLFCFSLEILHMDANRPYNLFRKIWV